MRFLEDRLLLRQDCMVPGLPSRQDAPQVALVGGCQARLAERHANVAVRWALAASHARRPEELLRAALLSPGMSTRTHNPTSSLGWGAAPSERRSPRMALASCSS